MKSLIKFLALGAVVASTSLAHATPVSLVGGDSFGFNVTGPVAPITSSTVFTLSQTPGQLGSTTGTGGGNLAGVIPYGTQITADSSTFSSSSLFSFTFGTYGTFTETAAPLLEGVVTSAGAEYYLLGTFTPGTSDSSLFIAGPASFDLGFTYNGTVVSGTGTLASPPATIGATPEPSSLILMGTGLVGLAGAVRRKFAK